MLVACLGNPTLPYAHFHVLSQGNGKCIPHLPTVAPPRTHRRHRHDASHLPPPGKYALQVTVGKHTDARTRRSGFTNSPTAFARVRNEGT